MTKVDETSKSISEKLTDNRVRLEKVNFEVLKSQENVDDLKLDVIWDYKLLGSNNGVLAIEATSQIGFKPEGLFKLDMTFLFLGHYDEDITDQEIEDSIEELLRPCGSIASLIAAQLVDKMSGTPIILPPTVKFGSKVSHSLKRVKEKKE